MSCIVPSCRSWFKSAKKSGENTSFHRFPENTILRQKWIDAVGLNNWTPTNHQRICSKHFKNDCFFRLCNRKVLLPNAIPTIFQSPLEGTHQNQQSEGNINEMMLSGNDRFPDAIAPTTSPKPLQGSYLNQRLGGNNNKIILSSNENLPDAIPTSYPRPLQQKTCQECLCITRQYQEKMLKQDEEIKSLSSEVEKLKKMLQRSNKDLERAKTMSKRRQLMVWRFKKRDERNSIKIDNLNEVINHLSDTKRINEDEC